MLGTGSDVRKSGYSAGNQTCKAPGERPLETNLDHVLNSWLPRKMKLLTHPVRGFAMTSDIRTAIKDVCKTLHACLPHRRTWLKALHGAMIPLLIWFIIMTPKDVVPMGIFQLHSVLALIFVTISLIWMADYMRRGLAGRPGPKLGPRARRVHWWIHRAIMYGLFGVAITGFLLGLTAPRLLKAGGFLPFAPPLDMKRANDLIGTFHIYEFYLLGVLVTFHAGFHIWRHLRVRDNALRIMAPKVLHRFL